MNGPLARRDRRPAADPTTSGATASIVIPVFNRADLTASCLTALVESTTGTAEVIVVDNASTDSTGALLASLGSAITVVRNAANEGFARACNAGAQRARGKYVVFLNNDTIPQAGWLDALIAAAESDPTVGAVGARLLYPNGTIQHAGIGFTANFEPHHLHQGVAGDAPVVSVDRDCEAVTGACLLMPRSLFHDLGGFDEGYQMYFEDVDLCLRVRASGRRVRYAADSIVVHLEQGSSASFSAAFAHNRVSRERFRARWLREPAPRDDAGASPQPTRVARGGPLRVVFMAHDRVLTHPGGDTVVVQRLMGALAARGVRVSLSHDATIPAGTDVVHTLNFATADVTSRFAEAAERAGVPLVVTALYEDWSRFLLPAQAAFHIFAQAPGLVKGTGLGMLQEMRPQMRAMLQQVRAQGAAPPGDNRFTASYARALIACGESERQRLLRDFPMVRDVRVIPFGADQLSEPVEPELFARTHGVRDFVLCVGRFEARKNQLMLLEALRDDPRPIVLVDGGVEHAPEYARLCRGFPRRGRTLVPGRLTSALLAAAFREAAVFCLPSWYELPGLVTIEAARHGTRIAASSWGAIHDYLGDTITYLEPDDLDGIAPAIATAAASSPDAAAARARAFTWEASASAMLALYEESVPIAKARPPQTSSLVAGATAR